MPIVHFNRIPKLDRLRLCSPSDAKDDLILAAAAQILGNMAKIIPQPIQAMPPEE